MESSPHISPHPPPHFPHLPSHPNTLPHTSLHTSPYLSPHFSTPQHISRFSFHTSPFLPYSPTLDLTPQTTKNSPISPPFILLQTPQILHPPPFRRAPSIFQRGGSKKTLDPALKSGSRKFWWGDDILN